MAFCCRIRVLPGVHRCANQLVGEGHHPPRRPERIVGPHVDERRHRGLRLPRGGIEVVAFERADGRIRFVGHRLPRAEREAEREEAAAARLGIVEVLPAHVPFMRIVRHAECRADILEIVRHDHAAVPAAEHVERVAGLPVHQIRPGAEDAQRAQLAALLVRHEIVRVVGAGARVPERPEYRARNQGAGGDTVGAVGVARRLLEDAREIVARERCPRARRPLDRRFRIDRGARRIEARDERLEPGCSRAPRRAWWRLPPRRCCLPASPEHRTAGTMSARSHRAR